MSDPNDITQLLAGLEDKAEALLLAWAGGATPADTPASYVLARLLCRARVLRTKESNVIQGRRLLVFEAVRSHQLFSVFDQCLGNEEMEAVQRDLLAQLRYGPQPPPIPAAARQNSAASAAKAEDRPPSAPPSSRAPRPRRPAGEESKSLLQAATRSLYRANAFRITGLPVDATTRDLARHADRLRMLEELGEGGSAHSAAFALQPPPSQDQIRNAIQRLKDPEERAIDEFFWFWPEEFGRSAADPAIQALVSGHGESAQQVWSDKEANPQDGTTALHNLAVFWHLTALDQEQGALDKVLDADSRRRLETSWRNAFARWDAVATSEAFWEKVGGRVRQLQDPRLTTGFVRRLRATLPAALDKINGELALAYAEQGDLEMATLHVRLMRESNQGLDDVEQTAELVLTPARKRLEEQIRRAKQRVEENPKNGIAAARELLEHAQRAVVLFDLFFGKASEVRREVFDEVATVCGYLPAKYHEATHDDATCLAILRSALNFASAIEVRRKIQENIDALTGNLKRKEFEPVYRLLKAIQESKEYPRRRLDRFRREVVPLLSQLRVNDELLDAAAIVLGAISAAAWNGKRDGGAARAANELALRYARRADLRQQLNNDQNTLLNAAQQSSNQSTQGCLTAIVGIILAVLYFGAQGSCNRPATPRNYNYDAPAPSRPASPPRRVGGNRPLGWAAPQPPAPDQSSPPPPGEQGNSTAPPPSGSPPLLSAAETTPATSVTYQVPTVYRQELDRDRAAIQTAQNRLNQTVTNLQTLWLEIQTERPQVDHSRQFSVDTFNWKVQQYDTLLARAQREERTFNRLTSEYNAKLRRYSQQTPTYEPTSTNR